MIFKNCRLGILTPIVSAFILLSISGCSSYGYNDSFWGRDKLYHFTASGVIGAGTTLAASRNGQSYQNAPLIGITVAMSVGASKEYYDQNIKGTFWSWNDMFWDLAGGTAGSYLVNK
ncbi:hypothetical protein ACFL6K_00895 [Candidatus Latescibacterota bacterium]